MPFSHFQTEGQRGGQPDLVEGREDAVAQLGQGQEVHQDLGWPQRIAAGLLGLVGTAVASSSRPQGYVGLQGQLLHTQREPGEISIVDNFTTKTKNTRSL